MTTLHSMERTKERVGFKGKTATNFIEKAIIRGKGISDYSSVAERKFLEKQEAKGDCTAIVYNGFCFIVSRNNACLTVYNLPDWFDKKKHYDGKVKIKNTVKYYRYYRNKSEKATLYA